MKDYFIELPYHVKDMTAEELKEYFGSDIEKSVLMRSIIMSEKNHGTVTYERSLRSFWYSAVKPTLDKLGLLEESDQTEESLTKWDAVLSRYVADLLRRGYLTYSELNIVDNSRQRTNPHETYSIPDITTYGYQVTAAPYSNIIIATEKDTVYNIIKDIANLFGCSCISSKGQNSLGAMESLIKGMNGHKQEEITILTMTDYDPAGYYIANALKKQARDISNALGYNPYINIERIGIKPEQLDYETVQANKYTPKKANLDKWFELTHGIYGEKKGLELDALEPNQIRRIFVDRIMAYIDTNEYINFVKESYIRKRALISIAHKMSIQLNNIVERFIDEVEIIDFDIKDYAINGYSSIPITSICSNDLDIDIDGEARKIIIGE